MSKLICYLIVPLLGATFAWAQSPHAPVERPAEIGLVDWNRDLEAAKSLAKETGKPLFVQFQEVPG